MTLGRVPLEVVNHSGPRVYQRLMRSKRSGHEGFCMSMLQAPLFQGCYQWDRRRCGREFSALAQHKTEATRYVIWQVSAAPLLKIVIGECLCDFSRSIVATGQVVEARPPGIAGTP